MADPRHQNHHYDTSLTDEYVQATSRQAEVVHDFRHQDVWSRSDLSHQPHGDGEAPFLVKEILCADDDPTVAPGTEPMAFVIRNVLSPSECDELIATAEDYGIEDGEKYLARTAKRTNNYTNASLSEKVEKRIQHILESRFRDPAVLHAVSSNEKKNHIVSNAIGDNENASNKHNYMGPFYGIHTNWRVLRYDANDGNTFPAHQDQMDSFQKPKKEGSGQKDLIISTHTLLLQLSEDSLEGGCTRFYPRAKVVRPKQPQMDETSFRKNQFDHAVDVIIPRGWALVFRQRGLLHAGQPVSVSSPCSKYVAQAGVLREMPEGVLQRPSIFKNGPGVTKGAF